MTSDVPVPPPHPPQTPTVARVYDAVLGGKDNYAVDREIAESIMASVPQARLVARDNRDFLIRAVRHMARSGITQFLDLGAGLPTMENTHQAAQRIAPEARVVYVDNDPVVLAHGHALLEDNDSTRVVVADLRDIEPVFAAPETRRLLDLSRPVGLLMISIIHHLDDADDPHALVRAYLQRLAPGSMLALSHFYDGSDLSGPLGERVQAKARASEEIVLTSLGSGRFRSRAEITAFFDGLELDEFGVCHLPEWRPEGPVGVSEDQRVFLCGVGRKPDTASPTAQ
ncbi:SAM-dependent methyltransferase [Streptomonospora sp. PA3]|uniref:SAM-dependent methyltransferase n=1 Tax=Streptomonospora sp. PA3 TaxID=2607326 RepID=UPI0012DEA616|nr:SAM-dependent methyltransferase [Streptomonospora sp. PA3]MUL41421.1 SAM-dependent methyltransferase [Streptomonospora sp. PA3]